MFSWYGTGTFQQDHDTNNSTIYFSKIIILITVQYIFGLMMPTLPLNRETYDLQNIYVIMNTIWMRELISQMYTNNLKTIAQNYRPFLYTINWACLIVLCSQNDYQFCYFYLGLVSYSQLQHQIKIFIQQISKKQELLFYHSFQEIHSRLIKISLEFTFQLDIFNYDCILNYVYVYLIFISKSPPKTFILLVLSGILSF